MRRTPPARVLTLLAALAPALLPAPAQALCRCVCVQGTMRPICQQTDVMVPICQGMCVDDVRPPQVVRPIAGGQQQFAPVTPANPAPFGLQETNPDYNSDTRGFPLGTPGALTGAPGASLSGGTPGGR